MAVLSLVFAVNMLDALLRKVVTDAPDDMPFIGEEVDEELLLADDPFLAERCCFRGVDGVDCDGGRCGGCGVDVPSPFCNDFDDDLGDFDMPGARHWSLRHFFFFVDLGEFEDLSRR